MSELTICNYCSWQSMKRRGYRKATAAERKKLWDEKVKADGFADRFSTGVVIVNAKGEFTSWFMELPDHCYCCPRKGYTP